MERRESVSDFSKVSEHAASSSQNSSAGILSASSSQNSSTGSLVASSSQNSMTGGSGGCVENCMTGACIAGNTSCDHSTTSNSKRMKTVRKHEKVYCSHCERYISKSTWYVHHHRFYCPATKSWKKHVVPFNFDDHSSEEDCDFIDEYFENDDNSFQESADGDIQFEVGSNNEQVSLAILNTGLHFLNYYYNSNFSHLTATILLIKT